MHKITVFPEKLSAGGKTRLIDFRISSEKEETNYSVSWSLLSNEAVRLISDKTIKRIKRFVQSKRRVENIIGQLFNWQRISCPKLNELTRMFNTINWACSPAHRAAGTNRSSSKLSTHWSPEDADKPTASFVCKDDTIKLQLANNFREHYHPIYLNKPRVALAFAELLDSFN